MGLLDLPSPLFDGLDAALATIARPAWLRVPLYAVTCGWLSMALYRRWSNQDRLLATREQIARVQARLAAHDGAFDELTRLIFENFKLTLRQLAMTLRPALFASLPLVVVLPWLSNAFALDAPVNVVHVCAQPPQSAVALHWRTNVLPSGAGCWDVTLPAIATDDTHALLVSLPENPRSEILQKFVATNLLIGNPNGYLPRESPVEQLTLTLAPRELLWFGPAWLRGWEPLFFATLFAASMFLRYRWRVV